MKTKFKSPFYAPEGVGKTAFVLLLLLCLLFGLTFSVRAEDALPSATPVSDTTDAAPDDSDTPSGNTDTADNTDTTDEAEDSDEETNEGEEPEAPEPQKLGLVEEDGHLCFYLEDGSLFTAGLKEVVTDQGVKYYWFGTDGIAFTNGLKEVTTNDGIKYYFFGTDGIAFTDGLKEVTTDKGVKYYFFGTDGTAFTDGLKEVATANGVKYYFFGADGSAFTGGYKSLSLNGKRVYYYFQADGSAYTGGYLHFTLNGTAYDFYYQENGQAFTGGYKEVTIDGQVYSFYFLANGQSYHSGYKTVSIDGKKYYFYFDTNGRALKNTQKSITFGSRTAYFLFGSDGKAFTGGYKEVKSRAATDYYYYLSNGQAYTSGYKTVKIDGNTYYFYFLSNGKAFTGGKKDIAFGTKTYTYYFQANGRAYTNTSIAENGVRIYFQENGRLREGLQQADGKTYFFKGGVRQTGMIQSGSKYYYFGSNYEMVRNQVVSVGGARYKFGSDGAQTPMTVSETGKTITGHHSFVYNYTDGILMYSDGNMYDTIYPASTTKLLTCAIALQIVDRNATVTLGTELDLTEPDASRAYLPVGGRISIKDLTGAVLVPSGSDAAWALAYQAGKILTAGQNLTKLQTVQVFMKELNKRAKELGLVHTNYTAPDGMPDYDKDGLPDYDHYTCMADQIKIACLACADPTIDAVVRAPIYYGTVSGITQKWGTTNPFLRTTSRYYDPYVTGLKSGTTTPAGACYMARVEYGGKTYIVGVFGSPKGTTGRYDDIVTLKNYFVYGK